MDLKSQVCNLELAKKLKELRVKQESLWCWVKIKENSGKGWKEKWHLDNILDYPESMILDSCSAFTVAELANLTLKDSNIEWKLFCNSDKWMIQSGGTFGYHDPDCPLFAGDSLANILAKMEIWLIEQGKVKI